MAGGKSGFWDAVRLSLAGFFLCVVVIVMAAKLVDSLVSGRPDVAEGAAAANTEPKGRVYYR